MMQPNNKPIRKRTQIDNTNRIMFIWVAAASALVGAAVVSIVFLLQMTLFNEKVLAEKSKTESTLSKNKSAVSKLEDNVRLLDVNQALIDTKANSDDKPLQVILDALPSEANSLAFGSSLETRLLAGINGLEIGNDFQVDPVQGVETLDTLENNTLLIDAAQNNSITSGVITFKFSVTSSDPLSIRQALFNLERSIRTIDVTSLKFSAEDGNNMGQDIAPKLSISVEGRAFYELSKNIDLTDKVIKQ